MHRRVLMALFVFALAIGIGVRLLPDRLEQRLHQLAGPGAVDCSDHRVVGADAYMNQTYSEGRAFFGRRDTLADHISGSLGVVCRTQGRAIYIHQNSAIPQGHEEAIVISHWSPNYSWLP